jgi:hypothetical protein
VERDVTGGRGSPVGPEGSYLNIPLVLLVTLLFHLAFSERMPFPDPAALKTPFGNEPTATTGLIS